ncbi:hypothetical protein OGAPHI_001261 [Ogataea philodendri]|uniref:Uncharacterized protein n=1 Tax=Ogataea philodendri TaxID=1378263 RepID=A0A9P8T9X1_9ASCO|nr:uncharacterized protein OGAPHI_001261 [Ogataea philodendri]KAH3670745.1 hypothetical protein OGAPHI_001261 [Ogataea philodendri]
MSLSFFLESSLDSGSFFFDLKSNKSVEGKDVDLDKEEPAYGIPAPAGRFPFQLMSETVLASRSVGQKSNGRQKVGDHHRLEHVKLKLSRSTSKGDTGVVSKHLGANHGHGLVLGRVDFSWHNGRAWLVFWQCQFAVTATRTRSKVSDIVGDLVQRGGHGVECSGGLDNGVVGSQGLELVWSGLKLQSGQFGHLRSNFLSKTFLGVQSGSDSGSSLSEESEGQWSGILQVSSSNLDDVGKLLSLLVQRVSQGLHFRQQMVGDLGDGGNVHHCWESVVRRLRHVDMIVRMNGFFRAKSSAQNLNGSVTDHLVGVHVGLGSRTGLENNQWKMVNKLSIGNLSGSLFDCVSQFRVQHTKLLVDSGSGFLQDSKSMHNWSRHDLSWTSDLEVLQRSLGLGSPILVVSNLDVSKGILLCSHGSGGGRKSSCSNGFSTQSDT